ncbi:hypothetical protein GYMLUDRAFT_40877 [Collybiopsis luxurians FD-317 M1]|uniref:Homeobox domain-containing protein n=1 Tax=Collybiopsis luxurians FD-317 M1 TaxID=944289 RepID=A0A0D0C6L4_9AGAR|nr:hypothetical protein GYMLUDRAFT_40877 [Collybiopsis luxurians FD-317 M1]
MSFTCSKLVKLVKPGAKFQLPLQIPLFAELSNFKFNSCTHRHLSIKACVEVSICFYYMASWDRDYHFSNSQSDLSFIESFVDLEALTLPESDMDLPQQQSDQLQEVSEQIEVPSQVNEVQVSLDGPVERTNFEQNLRDHFLRPLILNDEDYEIRNTIEPYWLTSAPQKNTQCEQIQDVRPVITEEACQILRDVFQAGICKPNTEQRRHLLAQIKALPNCGNCRMKDILNWFSENRRRQRSSSQKNQASSRDQTTHDPSITRSTPEILHILLSDLPNPPRNVISTWAYLLKITVEDVEAWISLERARALSSDQSMPAHSRSLPLPCPSLSCEEQSHVDPHLDMVDPASPSQTCPDCLSELPPLPDPTRTIPDSTLMDSVLIRNGLDREITADTGSDSSDKFRWLCGSSLEHLLS